MKALTLTQPWASLVALDEKRFETRGWNTGHRGLLAIHAAKGYPDRGLRFDEPFRSSLWHPASSLAYPTDGPPYQFRPDDPLPLGCVVAITTVTDCVPVEKVVTCSSEHIRDGVSSYLVGAKEIAFGDYTRHKGRYAIALKDTLPLPYPTPAKGMLGLWEWQPDDPDIARWLALWQEWEALRLSGQFGTGVEIVNAAHAFTTLDLALAQRGGPA